MKDDELDGIMNEEEITPTAGFVLSVMGAVRRDAVAPPAIEFPWGRALPAFAVLATSFVLCFVLLIREALGDQPAHPALNASIVGVATTYGIGWIALALALTFVSVKLPSLILAKNSRSRHFLTV